LYYCESLSFSVFLLSTNTGEATSLFDCKFRIVILLLIEFEREREMRIKPDTIEKNVFQLEGNPKNGIRKSIEPITKTIRFFDMGIL